jgi:hypothetical protein
VNALRSSHPKLRTSGESVSIHWDAEFLKNVLNVTLTTDLGPISRYPFLPALVHQLRSDSQERRIFEK